MVPILSKAFGVIYPFIKSIFIDEKYQRKKKQKDPPKNILLKKFIIIIGIVSFLSSIWLVKQLWGVSSEFRKLKIENDKNILIIKDKQKNCNEKPPSIDQDPITPVEDDKPVEDTTIIPKHPLKRNGVALKEKKNINHAKEDNLDRFNQQLQQLKEINND